ncbi:hypothetical protein [Streptomyces qinzhouensis]|uniref:Uncharacterized protein n=1 Tax=Streptomyces qinzhouensis TaxID=2599401 RepID=A0A5B8JBM1_9ACTN|nr:hypothetical protein [Streptomyces qinzhouensis]QDY78766.1 hypothetical protein FQU76_22155 [Streptomyces qinzhouensis]
MTDPDFLPRFHGRVVPWITPWSATPALPEPVVLDRKGHRIAYADESVHDRAYDGVLLARGRGRRGGDAGGRPLYEQLDPRRQRRALSHLLCQVCGGQPPPTRHGLLWLLAGPPEDDPEDVLTITPPICPEPCAVLATEQCPALAHGYTALWVGHPRAWGYRGTLHTPALARSEKPVQLPYGDPRLPWLLADLTVTRLMGCTITNLAGGQGRPGAPDHGTRTTRRTPLIAAGTHPKTSSGHTAMPSLPDVQGRGVHSTPDMADCEHDWVGWSGKTRCRLCGATQQQ